MGLLLEILITGAVAFVLVQMLIPDLDSIVPSVAVKVGDVIYSSSTISGDRRSRLVTGYVIENEEGKAGREFEQVQDARQQHWGSSQDEIEREKASTSSVNMTKEGKRGPRAPWGRQGGNKDNSAADAGRPELLNPYVIEKIIQGSDKTYRFTEKYIERQGVKVELISITPGENDYFLKFKIKNSSKDYFIPQGWACRHGEVWVETEKFFPKYLVEAGEEVAGYLRVKASYDSARRGDSRPPSAEAKAEWVFQLQESGGAYRKFSIFY